MSIHKSFNIEQLIKIATENNTDTESTVDDLIFGLSQCKQNMTKGELPSLKIIKSDEFLSNILKTPNKKERLKLTAINVTCVGTGLGVGISKISEYISIFEFLGK